MQMFLPRLVFLSWFLNPCPCGYYGDKSKECSCSPVQIQRYLRRLSGPLLDRIDMHVEITRVEFSDLEKAEPGEASALIKERVEKARAIQRQRFANSKPTVTCNAQMPASLVRKHCRATSEAKALLKTAFKQLNLSARSHDKLLKVARTIADLAGSDSIEASHMAEALQYRSLENMW
ncbi:ATP-binding protein [Peptococcaceae bacterium 1198_IL3148]